MTTISSVFKIKLNEEEISKLPTMKRVVSIVRYLLVVVFGGMLTWVCLSADNPILQGKAIVAAFFVFFFLAFRALAKK